MKEYNNKISGAHSNNSVRTLGFLALVNNIFAAYILLTIARDPKVQKLLFECAI